MTDSSSTLLPMTVIGGGNMAQALLSGWLKQGLPATALHVVEPQADTRLHLQKTTGVHCHENAADAPTETQLVVWAIKPQVFKEVASPLAHRFSQALHLSVAAGVRSDSIARWLGTERVVRVMPNTPALVGLGQSGLFARAQVSSKERDQVQQLMQAVGESVWTETEEQLDAVTALSGSGPAYVFFFIEAMTQAGMEMGLPAAQAQQLAIGTFVGASELARSSNESPAVLRERVTSKGGTTFAAISSMQQDNVSGLINKALAAARQRSEELGNVLDQA